MKKASDLIGTIFNEIQRNEGQQYIKFNNSWIEIVGEKLGHNTKIKDIVDGNLIIEIDHPGWKQLLNMKEKYIIKQISKNFPELKVKKIKYYFKNNNKLNNSTTEIIIDNKKLSDNMPEMDNDFKSLLKKMNKRSEE